MPDRSVKITVGANVAPLKAAMADGSRSVSGLTGSVTTLGERLKSRAQFIGLTAGILSVGAAVKGVFTLGLNFTQQLNDLQAVTQATGDQMTQVSAKARQLGNDVQIPATSAADAAEAMTELAKGGLSVSQAMDAAKGTLQLAAAAQVSGAQAATIQANALNTFGLKATDAGHVADVLANTANAASGEITDFAQAMQQSGSVAKLFGISIEDTSTALGLFANNGVKGSDAGTSLKSMLTQLATPSAKAKQAMSDLGLTIYDNQGKFVGLRSLTGQLADAQGRMSQAAFQSAAGILFGSDAIRAASILASSGVGAYDQFRAAVDRAGGAADLANAKMQGLPGALQQAENAIQDVALQIYDKLAPAVETLVRGFSDAIPKAASVLLPILGAVFDVLGLGVSIISTVAGVFNSLPGPIQAFGVALVALAIAQKIGLISSLSSAFDGMRLRAMYAGDAIRGMSFASLATGARTAGAAMLGAFGGPVGLAIAGVTLGIGLLTSAFGGNSAKAQETKAHIEGLTQAYIDNNGAIDANIRASVAKRLEDDGVLKQAAALGLSLSTVTDAALGNASAVDAIAAAAGRSSQATITASSSYQNAKKYLDDAGISAYDLARAVSTTGDVAPEVAKKWQSYIDSLRTTRDGTLRSADAQRAYSLLINDASVATGEYNDILRATGAESKNNAEAQAAAARQSEASASSTQDLSDSWNRAGGAMGAAGSVAADTASSVKGLSDSVQEQVNELTALLNIASQTRSALSSSTTGFVSPMGAYQAAQQKMQATQSSGGGGGGGGGGSKGPSPLVTAATALVDQAKKDRDAIDERYKDLLDVTKARYAEQLAGWEKARDAVKAAADEAQRSAEAFLNNSKDRANAAKDEAGALADLAGFGSEGSTLASSLETQAVAQAKLNVAKDEQVKIEGQLKKVSDPKQRAELQDRLNTLIAQQSSLQAVAAAADKDAADARSELAKNTDLSTSAAQRALDAMQRQAAAAAEVIGKDQEAADVTETTTARKTKADDDYASHKTAVDDALKALQDKADAANKAAADKYQTLLDAKNAAETVSKASSVSHGGGVSGAAAKMAADAAPSFQAYMQELQKQVDAQTRWKENIISLASRVGPEVAIELAKMGPEAAPMIQMLADQTDTTLNTKWVPLFKKSTAQGTQDIQDELTKALDPTGAKGLALGNKVIAGLQDALKAAKDDPTAKAAIQAVIDSLQNTATKNPITLEVKLKAAQADVDRLQGDKGIAAWAKGLSGARADGGPVLSGRSYLIGERGPEILTMTSSGNGHVLSNTQSQPILRGANGGGGGVLTVNLVTNDPILQTMIDTADIRIDAHQQGQGRLNAVLARSGRT